MDLSFHCPLNSVSFGQVSVALLREVYKREMGALVALIGDKPDLSAQQHDTKFFQWVEGALKNFNSNHKSDSPSFKLWHFNGSLSLLSDNQCLMTFYELDSPTKTELNIAKFNKKLIVTSRYTQEVFESNGVKTHFVPLGFDSANFKRLDKKYYDDDRIVFNLTGKFEHRKHHAKILAAWAKKFGGNTKYMLQGAIFNPFLSPNDNNELISRALGQKQHVNISFLPSMEKNSMYNDYLNSGDIIIGMAGGEGWGLPEFQSVAMGKHSVVLNAHSYKDWANKDNSVMVEPSAMIDCVDGIFFKRGQEYNQGRMFDWNEDDFISACEEAIKRVELDRTNTEGLKLQEEFTYSNTLDGILSVLKE